MGATLAGRNGDGDRYFTDGEIEMLVLTAGGVAAPAVPTQADPPLRIQLKDRLWNAIRPLLRWLLPGV